MAKKILPNELAEIVTALLIDPDIIGEMPDQDRHAMFMKNIGQVVANYCGGFVEGVGEGDAELPGTLSLARTEECDTGSHTGAWALHDIDGWDMDDSEFIGESKAQEIQSMNQTRGAIVGLLVNKAIEQGVQPRLHFDLKDWDSGTSDDEATHSLTMLVGAANQPAWLIIVNKETGEGMEVAIEINKGVPALHIGNNDQMHMHVHRLSENNFTLTPDNKHCTFDKPDAGECPYNDSRTIALRVHLETETN